MPFVVNHTKENLISVASINNDKHLYSFTLSFIHSTKSNCAKAEA